MRSALVLPLLADTGLPMIYLAFPGMVLLLIPIIVVEALLCRKWLGLTTWQALKSNAASNVVSTIAGIPLAWAIMLGVEIAGAEFAGYSQTIEHWHGPLASIVFLVFSSAWLGPPDEKNLWVIPAATLVLLVPFFFVSYLIEYLVMKYLLRESGVAFARMRVAVRNANLVTYGALFALTSLWLIQSLPRHLSPRFRYPL